MFTLCISGPGYILGLLHSLTKDSFTPNYTPDPPDINYSVLAKIIQKR